LNVKSSKDKNLRSKRRGRGRGSSQLPRRKGLSGTLHDYCNYQNAKHAASVPQLLSIFGGTEKGDAQEQTGKKKKVNVAREEGGKAVPAVSVAPFLSYSSTGQREMNRKRWGEITAHGVFWGGEGSRETPSKSPSCPLTYLVHFLGTSS